MSKEHHVKVFRAIFAACVAATTLQLSTLPGAAAAISNCAINTGLDPSCPLTSSGISTSDTALSDKATEHAVTVFSQTEWRGRNQLRLSLPIHQRFQIENTGSANGTGDLALQFDHVLTARTEPFMQVIGATLTVPSGSAAFSAGRVQVTPSYTLSYAARRGVQLMVTGDYTVDAGGARYAYAPSTQTLRVSPTALLEHRGGLYAAFNAEAYHVTGDYRYSAYDGSARIGKIFDGRYNVYAGYELPFGPFTRDHVLHHALIFGFSLQR